MSARTPADGKPKQATVRDLSLTTADTRMKAASGMVSTAALACLRGSEDAARKVGQALGLIEQARSELARIADEPGDGDGVGLVLRTMSDDALRVLAERLSYDVHALRQTQPGSRRLEDYTAALRATQAELERRKC